MNDTIIIIFSKDRAMQLRAMLESLFFHCQDINIVDITVFYKTTDSRFDNQYVLLEKEFEDVNFVREIDLTMQIITAVYSKKYVVFFVDDSVVVKSFDIQKVIDSLETNEDTIGFSLRLGINTTHSYMNCYREQKLPEFIDVDDNVYKYKWIGEQLDFGYPLEVSSSVYRVKDFKKIRFVPEATPNQIEGCMSRSRGTFKISHPYLLCFRTSVAFSVPVNKVNESNNPSNRKFCYPVQLLAEKFDQGYKIDIEKLTGFLPDSVHQEVELRFTK